MGGKNSSTVRRVDEEGIRGRSEQVQDKGKVMNEQRGDRESEATVCVVDDEPEIGDIVRRALERRYDVDVFESAHQLLSELDDGRRYDVVLCDLYMPGMSGEEVARRLADQWPEQANSLVLMSGASTDRGGPGDVEGFDGPMLQKPFRLAVLRETVSSVAGND